MMLSSNTCRFIIAFILAAGCNAVTTAKEATIDELPSRRSALRGNLATTTSATVKEQTRRLTTVAATGFAVQAGASIVFVDPPTMIHGGDVCAYGAVTGDEGIHYAFTNEGGFSDSELVTSAGCDPMAGTRGAYPLSLFDLREQELIVPAGFTAIDAEIGGKTFGPGTYYSSSLTMTTDVILKGNGVFRFIYGSTMITGAHTTVVLEAGTGDAPDIPVSADIKWAVTAAATTGAFSDVKGSIVAGAAITLGENAKVSGCILASAAITVGAECTINYDLVDPRSLIQQ
jgi:hypothetical protein